jgi:hypothetical protein
MADGGLLDSGALNGRAASHKILWTAKGRRRQRQLMMATVVEWLGKKQETLALLEENWKVFVDSKGNWHFRNKGEEENVYTERDLNISTID